MTVSSEGKRWLVWEDSNGRLQTCARMTGKAVDEYCFEVVPASEVERLREALANIARDRKCPAAVREMVHAALADDKDAA